jgi:hypothetical protein
VASERRAGVSWQECARPQPRLDAERIAELERKIGQQAMEIDFLKKALRRFREHPLRVVANGEASSMSKSLGSGRSGGSREGLLRCVEDLFDE